MDDILLRCATRCLGDPQNLAYAQKQIIKRTHGFEYDKHFREMLIRLIGLAGVERLEQSVDSAKQTRMKATLGILTTARNTEAHTHLKGTTRVINAPSTTRTHFNDIYEGLIDYERLMRNWKP